MQTESLFKEALLLSPVDRVKLMDLLIDSFQHDEASSEHELAWAEHAENICIEIDKNRVELHSLESVLAELNK